MEEVCHFFTDHGNLRGNPDNYHVTVVDVATVNAFALPAGQVFVTAPLIALAASEAELAGVIGHEVGHVMARHTAERMYVREKEQNKIRLLCRFDIFHNLLPLIKKTNQTLLFDKNIPASCLT